MPRREETRELERITHMWTAANDAKAQQIRELEDLIRVWGAANDIKGARIEELEAENEVLRGALAALRHQLAGSGRKLRRVA